MKLLVVVILAVAATIALAMLIARLADSGASWVKPMRSWVWAVGTMLLLILGVYAAHLTGLFSVPLVALAFLAVGIPVRAYLGATREARRQREAAARRQSVRDARGVEGLLARHQIVVLAVLVSFVAVAAGVVAAAVGPN